MKPVAPLLVALTLTSAASAQEERSTFAKTFIYGNSTGSPSTGKLVTLSTLYVATVAAAGTDTFLFVDHSAERADFDKQSADGCTTLAACADLDDRGSDIKRKGALAYGLFAAGSLTLLSGIVTAFIWDNQTVQITATPTGAWATVSF